MVINSELITREDREAVVLQMAEMGMYEKIMEEYANVSGEEMGKRQPGERCMYERK